MRISDWSSDVCSSDLASIRTLHAGNGEGRKLGEIVLNDDELMIRETARRFAAERVAPFAAEWDRSGQLPAGLLNEMGRLGLFGLLIPPAYGGSGSSFRTCERKSVVWGKKVSAR